MKIYTKKDIEQALLDVGIQKGDTVFSHSNLGFFGILHEAKTSDEIAGAFVDVLQSVIGSSGNICVPTFTYSFCNNQPYDLLSTPSKMGMYAEFVRKHPHSVRSEDANFSVSVMGEDACGLTENLPDHSFGKGSFWTKFLDANGKILNLNWDATSTLIHYAEKDMEVYYRFDKSFSGKSFLDGEWRDRTFIHFVRHLDKPEWDNDYPKMDRLIRSGNFILSSKLGGGSVIAMSGREVFSFIKSAYAADSSCLIKASNFQKNDVISQ